MTSLTEHLIKLTDHRDRDLLELTLAKALVKLLPIDRVVIARVMRHESWETTRKHYAPGDVQRDAEVLRATLAPPVSS